MHVITKAHLMEAASKYRDAADEISAWLQIVKGVRWTRFVDVRKVFPDADSVGRFVIFNIRHTRYRLVTIIRYAKERNGKLTEGHVFIRSFLTHKEYDNPANWDKEYGTR